MAQHHRANRHALDGALALADIEVFADPERVVEQEKDARQDVANQRLRAEADRDADDSGARQQRPDIDAHRRYDAHQRHRHDRDEQKHPHQRKQRFKPRQTVSRSFVAHQGERVPLLVRQMTVDRDLDDAPRRGSQQKRNDDLEDRFHYPRAKPGRAEFGGVEPPKARHQNDRHDRERDAAVAHDNGAVGRGGGSHRCPERTSRSGRIRQPEVPALPGFCERSASVCAPK